jgi:hypothetical protein
MTVLDSSFKNVEKAIIIAKAQGHVPNVVLDNIDLENVGAAVSNSAGETLYQGGNTKILSWLTGRRYTTDSKFRNGGEATGEGVYPFKAASIMNGPEGKFFEREKPQYQGLPPSKFLNVLDFGVRNDASPAPWNVDNINKALKAAVEQDKILVFPAGVYLVDDTVFVPIGSRIAGILYPQIVAHGNKFGKASAPKVVVKVANPGDKGAIEIQDLILTSRGATAGAVFMQWNAHESTKGSAAMWDVIVRVGGAIGTELDSSTCHQNMVQDLSKYVFP